MPRETPSRGATLYCYPRSAIVRPPMASPLAADERLNLAVMSVHKDLLTREFVRFLRSLDLAGDDLVLVDTATLDARVHHWFLDLTRRFLDYRTVVLFTGRKS